MRITIERFRDPWVATFWFSRSPWDDEKPDNGHLAMAINEHQGVASCQVDPDRGHWLQVQINKNADMNEVAQHVIDSIRRVLRLTTVEVDYIVHFDEPGGLYAHIVPARGNASLRQP